MAKYNPKNIEDLSKGKMIQRAGYIKGTFIKDLGPIEDIIKNGGQVEIRAQEVRQNGDTQVQVVECRIYFIAASVKLEEA